MIKSFYKILALFLVLTLINCKKEDKIDVKKLILKYSLESHGFYKNGKRQENKWFSKDSTLTFTLYENRKTNYFLYLVKNRNKDNIFQFFDSTTYNFRIRNFFKSESNYFVTLWHPSLKDYIGSFSIPNGKNDIYESLFMYDSLNIYKVDTLSYQLTKIDKPSINNIKETIKTKDSFKVIKSNSKIRLIKDTLYNQKILYEYDVGLEIEKNNQNYSLKPYFFNKSERLLDQNNIATHTESFLSGRNLYGTIRYYYQYDSLFNNKGYSKLDLVFQQYDKEDIIETSLEQLFPNENFRYKYIHNKTSLDIETFKYKNGDYFLRINQDSDLRELSPKIYHIDTIDWKIYNVMPFDTKRDKTYKKIKKENDIKIFSDIHKSNLYFFSDIFEIVKVEDEYRIIKKNK